MKCSVMLLAVFLAGSLVHAGDLEMNFKNRDGTKDSYNPQTGQWELQFKNPDGSYDRYSPSNRGLGSRTCKP